MLLGGVMVAREGEGRVRRRSEERRVDRVLHPGRRGRVDEGAVLRQAVRALGRRHHEQHVDAGQRPRRRVQVAELGGGDVRDCVVVRHPRA